MQASPAEPSQPVVPDLAERLRSGTAEGHRVVERGPFIVALLRGEGTRAGYAGLLASLLPVYAALEAGLERHREDPRLAWIDLEALRRVPALTRDLAAFAGEAAEAVPAARAYALHLQRLAATAPVLLVAHAYTRYLGDLAGGQVLRRTVARAFGLSGESGVEFYAFPGELAGLRRSFRAGLSRLAVDEATAGAIVEEARGAFVRHGEMFDELAARG